jgi:SAM-dependent methyltransferase
MLNVVEEYKPQRSLPAGEALEFTLDWGVHALFSLITAHYNDFSNVLDVGGGTGEHTRFLRLFGKEAYSIDSHNPTADYKGDFLTYDFGRKFDAIYCSHVLEHQRNVGLFIERLYDVLSDDGILAIAVPVHSRQGLISGHITNWNAGLLIYNLVLGGFDCREARFLQQADLNLVVRKKPASGGDIRGSAAWDHIQSLAQYFPFPASNGCNGEVEIFNWLCNYTFPPIGRSATLSIKSRTIGSLTLRTK